MMELDKGKFMTILNTEVNYNYGTTGHTPYSSRSGRHNEKTTGWLVTSFIPTNKKYGESLGRNWIKQNDKTNYDTWGYVEDTDIIIRSFSSDDGNTKGAVLAEHFLERVEEYIKVNRNNLLNITGAYIDVSSFVPPREFMHYFGKDYFGYEMRFTIATVNAWTNEPVEGAISDVNVSGIYVNDGPKVWVE